MQPALFLDRDGVINVDTGYVHKPEQFLLVDGIINIIKKANLKGLPVIIVTNQAGIGRGYYSQECFLKFSRWVEFEIERFGAKITKTYFCPHHPTEGLGKYRTDCTCRKPAPGMFLSAQRDFNLDLSKSIMVGDKATDIEAALNAGVQKVYYLSATDIWEGSPRVYNITSLKQVII